MFEWLFRWFIYIIVLRGVYGWFIGLGLIYQIILSIFIILVCLYCFIHRNDPDGEWRGIEENKQREELYEEIHNLSYDPYK